MNDERADTKTAVSSNLRGFRLPQEILRHPLHHPLRMTGWGARGFLHTLSG